MLACTADTSTLFHCPLCHNTTLQHHRLPSVTTNVTRRHSKRIFARTTNHEDMGVVLGMWRWGIQSISLGSVLIVNTALAPSESHENGF